MSQNYSVTVILADAQMCMPCEGQVVFMKSLHSCVCMMSQLEALVLVMLTPVGDFL